MMGRSIRAATWNMWDIHNMLVFELGHEACTVRFSTCTAFFINTPAFMVAAALSCIESSS
jgi:hypothetical protein